MSIGHILFGCHITTIPIMFTAKTKGPSIGGARQHAALFNSEIAADMLRITSITTGDLARP